MKDIGADVDVLGVVGAVVDPALVRRLAVVAKVGLLRDVDPGVVSEIQQVRRHRLVPAILPSKDAEHAAADGGFPAERQVPVDGEMLGVDTQLLRDPHRIPEHHLAAGIIHELAIVIFDEFAAAGGQVGDGDRCAGVQVGINHKQVVMQVDRRVRRRVGAEALGHIIVTPGNTVSRDAAGEALNLLLHHVGDDEQPVGVSDVQTQVLAIDHRVGTADKMAGLDPHPALGPDAGVAQIEIVRLNDDAPGLKETVRLLNGRHRQFALLGAVDDVRDAKPIVGIYERRGVLAAQIKLIAQRLITRSRALNELGRLEAGNHEILRHADHLAGSNNGVNEQTVLGILNVGVLIDEIERARVPSSSDGIRQTSLGLKLHHRAVVEPFRHRIARKTPRPIDHLDVEPDVLGPVLLHEHTLVNLMVFIVPNHHEVVIEVPGIIGSPSNPVPHYITAVRWVVGST